MSADENDFKARLLEVSRLESRTHNYTSCLNDMRSTVRDFATIVVAERRTATPSVAECAERLHARWEQYQQSSAALAASPRSAPPHVPQWEEDAFLGAVAALVTDHLISLNQCPQPWEIRNGSETGASVDTCPTPSLSLTTEAESVTTADSNDWGWEEDDPLEEAGELSAKQDADTGKEEVASGWARVTLTHIAVWLPVALYQRWSAALNLMNALTTRTLAELPSPSARGNIAASVLDDLLTCMLLEIQRHASLVVLGKRGGGDLDAHSRDHLAQLRLASLHMHAELWVLWQCQRAGPPPLCRLASEEVAATVSDVLSWSVDVGIACCTRCLLSPASTAAAGSSPKPQAALRSLAETDPLNALRVFLSDMRAALTVPSAVFAVTDDAAAVGADVQQLSLWQKVVTPWLCQVLLPIAQELLNPNSKLARLWRQDERNEPRAVTSGADCVETALPHTATALTVQLGGVLHVFAQVLGTEAVRHVSAYRTLSDLTTRHDHELDTPL